MEVNPSKYPNEAAVTTYSQYERQIGDIFNQKTSQRLADFFPPSHFLPHFNANYDPQLALYEETGKLPNEIQTAMLTKVQHMTLPDLFSQI